MMLLDAACWLGHWPFHDTEPDTSAELCAHQASRGISLSCVASLEAVFYCDPRPANLKLLRELRDHPTLEPVIVLNPSLRHTLDALEHYVRRHRCRQVRLVPSYHGYALDAPEVDRLCEAASRLGVRLGIVAKLADEACCHPRQNVPPTPLDQIEGLAARHPEQTFLVLGATFEDVPALAPRSNLLLEISHLETLATLDTLLQVVPAERLVLGTSVPLLVSRCAIAKVRHATAGREVKAAVAGENLARWLGGPAGRVPYPDPDPY